MKFVTLLTAAYVGGVLRHPHEGALHVEDDEADRLIENQVAEDVSGDFSAKQDRETPVESISVESGAAAPPSVEHPHQAEVPATASEAPTKPAARKPAASKE